MDASHTKCTHCTDTLVSLSASLSEGATTRSCGGSVLSLVRTFSCIQKVCFVYLGFSSNLTHLLRIARASARPDRFHCSRATPLSIECLVNIFFFGLKLTRPHKTFIQGDRMYLFLALWIAYKLKMMGWWNKWKHKKGKIFKIEKIKHNQLHRIFR